MAKSPDVCDRFALTHSLEIIFIAAHNSREIVSLTNLQQDSIPNERKSASCVWGSNSIQLRGVLFVVVYEKKNLKRNY